MHICPECIGEDEELEDLRKVASTNELEDFL